MPNTFNWLSPGDATWRQGTRSTLAQVMACCLTAPSHYLNQCWLIIGEVHWHPSQALSLDDVKIPIKKYRLKISVLKWHPGLPAINEFNSLFSDDTFRCMFVNENFCILIEISLKFVPKGPFDNNPTLVQIMAWRLIGDKPLSEPMLTRFTDGYMRHKGEIS